MASHRRPRGAPLRLLAAAAALGAGARAQTCPSAATSLAARFTPGNLVALRLGDGSAALPTTATAVAGFLDEISPSGTIVQSLALPTGALVTNASGGIGSVGCTFNPSVATSGLLGLSLDGRGVSTACFPFAAGASITTAGSKTLLSVGFDGSLRPSVVTAYLSATAVSTAWATASLGGAVSDAHGDGAWTYFATASGPMVAKQGGISVGQLAGSTTGVQNMFWTPPYVYSVRVANAAALVASGTAAFTPLNGVYANSWTLSGTATTTTAGGVFMPDNFTLFIADAGTATTTKSLVRYTRSSTLPSATWTTVTGYPLLGIPLLDPNGTTVTTYSVRGIAGTVGAGGALQLYLSTALGIVAFNPALVGDPSAFSLVAAPCANTRWVGLSYAPVGPTPTPSPTMAPSVSATPSSSATGSSGSSPTASITASPTASVTASVTASPSNTASRTASATPSVSLTATPTMTSSPACQTATASAVPFTPGSIVTLRLGDGRAAVPTTAVGTPGYIDEWSPAGVLLQSVALPTGGVVADPNDATLPQSAGCVFNPAQSYAGLMGRSTNGQLLTVACFPAAAGASITAATPKTVYGLRWDGTVTMSVVNNYLSSAGALTSWSTAAIGGAITDDGSNFVFATGSGPIGVNGNLIGTGFQAGATSSAQNVLWQGSFLYSVRATSFATLAPAGNSTASVIGGFANSWSATGITTTATTGGAWFQDDLTLYLADSNTSSVWPTGRMITKFVRNATFPNSPWAVAPGFPVYNATVVIGGNATTVYGARGLTGSVAADGTVTLYVTTTAGVLRYVPSTGAWTQVVSPCGGANMRLSGIAMAPALPSATSTPTASLTPSASITASITGTPTQTPSSSSTQSSGATPTGSETLSATPSRTASTSVSASPTATLTSSASTTSTVTSTPTASSSPACQTATASAVPFTPGSIVTLRIGDGRAAVPTTAVGTPGYIDEWSPTGTLLQSVALPTGPAVTSGDNRTVLVSAGCVFNPAQSYAGLMGRSTNGQLLTVACFPAAAGASITAATPKTVYGLRWDGTVTASVVVNYASSAGALTSWSTAAIGGAITDDGSNFVFATGSGPIGIAGGVNGTGFQSGATSSAQNVLWQGSFLYSVRASSFATLAPSATSTSSVIGGFANSWTAPGITTTATTGGAWFQDDLTLYLADSNTSSVWPTGRMITKFVRNVTLPGSTWAVAPGFPVYNATVVIGGNATTVYGARGLTGSVAADGTVTLYVTTTAGVLRYVPSTGVWTQVVSPCGGANMRLSGITMAPALPSATSTPTASLTPSASITVSASATPPVTPSWTPTQSSGATPTPSETVSASPTRTPSSSPTSLVTASVTASPTATSTSTPTPTASTSPACFVATASAMPFTPGSIVTLRLGDGRSSVPTTAVGTPGYIDEWSPTGTLLQSVALPTGPAVTSGDNRTVLVSAGCVFNPAQSYAGLMGRSTNGQLLTVACFPAAAGASITAATPKTVYGLRWDGTVTASVVVNYASSAGALTSWSTAAIGGAITDDGSNFVFATGSGPIGIAGGVNGTGFQSGATSSAQNVLWQGAMLYSVRATSFATLAPAGNSTASVIGGFANSWSATGITTTATTGGAWFQDDLTLYLADSNTSSVWPTGRMITKFVRNATFPNSPWAVAPGFPVYNATVVIGGNATTVYGARGLTGSVAADGTVTLYVTTTAGVLRYVPSTGAWTQVVSPCGGANMRLSGIAMAPAVATPTPTATGTPPVTPSPTPSRSGTPSASTTASVSTSGTASRTATKSPSSSRTGTPSLTASNTASVSASSSETASVSASQTGTGSPSPSATGTPSTSGTSSETYTPSPSGSVTGSQSASRTAAATGTATGSGTRSPAASQSASKSRLPSASRTRSPSATATRTRTATATKTKTKTKTRTKTKTSTKKKLMMA